MTLQPMVLVGFPWQNCLWQRGQSMLEYDGTITFINWGKIEILSQIHP